MIWYEGVCRRKQEDLTSCFFQFLLFNKYVKNISMWMHHDVQHKIKIGAY